MRFSASSKTECHGKENKNRGHRQRSRNQLVSTGRYKHSAGSEKHGRKRYFSTSERSDTGSRGFDIFACFSSLQSSKPLAIGSFYRISTNSAFPFNETEQIANLMAAVQNVIEIERKTREDLWLNKPTCVKDRVYMHL